MRSTTPKALTSDSAPSPAQYTRHFYSLDVLRGLAALSIVFYHWRHFFDLGTKIAPFDAALQPGYFLLWPLYKFAWRAVSLFFSLSGFIFYWLYSRQVSEGRMSAKEFFIFRFSRLYPLHLVTLLIVACEQFVLFRRFGTFFVYDNNDLRHFILQLFLISSWGSERGFSFNGPVWSVSVEVFLYTVFFITCIFRFNRWWSLALLGCFSVVLSHVNLPWLSRGVQSFFVGGIAYQIFSFMWRRGLTRTQVLALILLTASVWIIVPLNTSTLGLYTWFQSCPWRASLMVDHKDLVGVLILIVTENSFEVLLFPLTILTFAVCEAFRGTLGKRLAFVGNISYSVYLIQSPMQLLFIFSVLSLSIPKSIFYSVWVMVGFFSLLMLTSLASYHFFERPAQRFLREKLSRASFNSGRTLGRE